MYYVLKQAARSQEAVDESAAFARFLSDGDGPPQATRNTNQVYLRAYRPAQGPSTEFPLSGRGAAVDVGTL